VLECDFHGMNHLAQMARVEAATGIRRTSPVETSIDRSTTAVVLSLFDTGLGIVRSLGRLGIPVLGLDSDSRMPGFRSRFCIAKVCPDPVSEPERLLRFLLAEGRRLARPGVLFPATDAFVLFVSRYRDDLAPYFRYALPAAALVERLANKRQQYELAEQAGIPYPRTFYPETMVDVQHLKNQVKYPLFIKPYYGHFWRERFGGTHKGFKVQSPEDLTDRFEEILPTGLRAMLQEIIPGPNTSLFEVNLYIGAGDATLAQFSWRKIRQYPCEFGVGSLVESVWDPELARLGLEFCHSIGYRGIASIEFKRDLRDGRFYLIELNPRLWQQNSHATACGLNFPLIQYVDLTGQEPEPQRGFAEGVKWLDAGADFQAFWDSFRRGELSPWSWALSWRGTRVFATFAWDDPGPFLRANEHGLKYLRLPLYLLKQRSP